MPYRRPSSPRRLAPTLAVLGLASAAALLGLTGQGAAAPAPAAERAATVLADRCLSCHNAEKKAGGIDLSTRAAFTAAKLGAAKADDSRLVKAVVSGKMPPTGKLPAAEIAALKAWVAADAPYAREPLRALLPSERPLWSLEPIRRVTPRKTRFDRLARNTVDRFVFAGLEQKGLSPSAPAGKRELLRRVSYDLTGLPPTPEEMAAFLADRSPEAYEKVVERLLASPAYGERWAQHWLDVVRYGDSHGYEQNHLRANAWPYRDYVIRALNQDTPYDRFIHEQLAADVVAKGDPRREVATGFLVAGVHDTVGNSTEEGKRQQRANDLDDIVSATAETFLGLTVGCAKCHDHKFDPIPQVDYYRLAAVFAGVRHGERPLPETAEDRERRVQADGVRQELRAVLGGLLDLQDEGRAALLRQRGAEVGRPPTSPRHNTERFAPVRARFVRFTVTATRDGMEPCLDELEVFGPDLPGNLALASRGGKAAASSLYPNAAIHQIHHLNDGKYGNDWSWISSERGKGWAQIELKEPARIDRVAWARDSSTGRRLTDRCPTGYRVEVSEDGASWKTVATGDDRAQEAERQPELEVKALGPEQARVRSELLARQEELEDRLESFSPRMAYVGSFGEPDPIYLLKRGDVMQRGDEVGPGPLSCVSVGDDAPAAAPQSEPQRRLEFARWLTDRRNPLTARVMVNRIWHHHFGRGLVATPSDFGHNGEKPTHPELLDWLATELMNGGWKLKRLHKMLVTTYTYRQSSAANPRAEAIDAGNQYLWRMPLRRLDAEALRDSVLAASGKLDRKMGGPGFRLFKYNVVNVAIYEDLEEHGPETWRRSVYHQRARGIRDDLLGSFDCPESSQKNPRRVSTTTALQALSLLNGPFLTQQAGFLAERLRKEAGASESAQVARAFQIVFGRAPSAEESKSAVALARQHGLDTLCRGLLNANEFLYY
ncbi:MAG: DUF1553 domain-containing protein [Armatimonadota bacterium]